MAALRPVCASEITSFTPCSPRLFRLRRKSVQKVSASDGPTHKPMISRRPSVLTAMAIMAATAMILPPWSTLR
jgi:hypothetical protein